MTDTEFKDIKAGPKTTYVFPKKLIHATFSTQSWIMDTTEALP